ncbi:ABC transporter permease subunit [Thalassospira xiamenensis]|uniref:ABC transporter permease subunit n=1 Tax=Thalassospira xiamenensis TaxID=220697 RepID=UPI003AA7FF53
MSEQKLKHFVPTPPRLPATNEQNLLRRIQKRCFNSIGNSLLTISVLVLIYYVAKSFLDWAVFNAVWNAATRRECMDISPDGACWAGVIDWFNGLIYGRYPDEEQWRVNSGVVMALLWLLPLMTRRIAYRNSILISWITLYPFLGAYMFLGGTFGQDVGIIHMVFTSLAAGYFILLYLNWMLCAAGQPSLPERLTPLTSKLLRRGQHMNGFLLVWAVLSILCGGVLAQVHLEPVPVDRWGGLFLTLIIASFAITMSIPVGILLALGRRSKLPVIHWLSMMLIELVRAVPLITVLFMAVTLLPIFCQAVPSPTSCRRSCLRSACLPGPIWPKTFAAACRLFPTANMKPPRHWGLAIG